MQSRIFAGTTVWAALTLGFASPVSAASQAAPVDGVAVKSFTFSAAGPFKAGDRIVTTLLGTPGGTATFAIPGVVEKVALKELSAGDYVGTFSVPNDIAVRGAAVVGLLRFQGIASPLVAANAPATMDSAPPIITAESPNDGALVPVLKPYISASLVDAGGIGVNPASVRVKIDGVDVTARADVTAYSVGYTPERPFSAGPHRVDISAADRMGNIGAAMWNFTEIVTPPATNFTADFKPNQAVDANQTVRFVLKGQPRRHASATIGGIAADIPLGEGTSGVYTGEYTCRFGDGTGRFPVWADFKVGSGKTYIMPLSSPILVNAGPMQPPLITDPPTDDIEAGSSINLVGTAKPGSIVVATVRYASEALGGLLPIKGEAGSQETVASSRGDWKIDKVPVGFTSLLVPHESTVFTVAVVSLSPDGSMSRAATVTVRHGQ